MRCKSFATTQQQQHNNTTTQQHNNTTTQQASHVVGRITTLLGNGKLFDELNCSPLNPDSDRVMICGSLALNNNMASRCSESGLIEGSNSSPGHFVVEKAFTEKS